MTETVKTAPKRYVAVAGIDFPKLRVEAGEPIPEKVRVPAWLVQQGKVKEVD